MIMLRGFCGFLLLLGCFGIGCTTSVRAFSLDRQVLDVAALPFSHHAPVKIGLLGLSDSDQITEITISSNRDWVEGTVSIPEKSIMVRFPSVTQQLYQEAQLTIRLGAEEHVLDVRFFHYVGVQSSKVISGSRGLDVYVLFRGTTFQPITNKHFTFSGLAHVEHAEDVVKSFVTLPGDVQDVILSRDQASLYFMDTQAQAIQEMKIPEHYFGRKFQLPESNPCCENLFRADLEISHDRFIYFSDGEENPQLHVFDMESNQIVQSIYINETGLGFGNFAISSDKSMMFAWAQNSWDFQQGINSPLYRFSIQNDGSLTFIDNTSNVLMGDFSPIKTTQEIFVPTNNEIIGFKDRIVQLDSFDHVSQRFPEDIYSLSPDGVFAASSSKVYLTETGEVFAEFPFQTEIQTFLSVQQKLVLTHPNTLDVFYFDFAVVKGPELLNVGRFPENNALAQPFINLEWGHVPGNSTYKVFLSDNRQDIEMGDPDISRLVGETNDNFMSLKNPLELGATYYWRIDLLVDDKRYPGHIFSFEVLPFGLSQRSINARMLYGANAPQIDLHLTGHDSTDWSVHSNEDWISITNKTGTGSGTISVTLNPRKDIQPIGEIQFSNQGRVVYSMPVNLDIDALYFRRLISSDVSPFVYGLATAGRKQINGHAYLVEINTITGSIDRVLAVGDHATDITVRTLDDTIFVVDGAEGVLKKIDIGSWQVVDEVKLTAVEWPDRTSDSVSWISDVSTERIIIEDWVAGLAVYLMDTQSGEMLSRLGHRDGAGSFDQSKNRYYFRERSGKNFQIVQYNLFQNRLVLEKAVFQESNNNLIFDRLLVSGNGERIFTNGYVFDNELSLLRNLNDSIYACSYDGAIAIGLSNVYNTETGETLKSIPFFPHHKPFLESRAYNSVSDTLVYQDSEFELHFERILGDGASAPLEDDIHHRVTKLDWDDFTVATNYEVYLGRSLELVSQATVDSSEFQGATSQSHIEFSNPITQPSEWYWRVDYVTPIGIRKGVVRHFTVAKAIPSKRAFEILAFSGEVIERSLLLDSFAGNEEWEISTNAPWIAVDKTHGSGDDLVGITITSRDLDPIDYSSSLEITQGDGPIIQIPIHLKVSQLNTTKLKSHSENELVYGLSEHRHGITDFNILFELNAIDETITRKLELTSGYSDFIVHEPEHRIYLKHISGLHILVVKLDSFEIERQINFTGTREKIDRIEPGIAGRILVRWADSPNRVVIYSTHDDQVITDAGIMANGFATAPSGKTLFVADARSSDYLFRKYDLSTDQFTELEAISFQISRNMSNPELIVSNSGNRTFYKGFMYDWDTSASWRYHEDIYSVSGEGEIAFGAVKILDIDQNKVIFGMQETTHISTYNLLAEKLVVQREGLFAFLPILQDDQVMKPPVLKLTDVQKGYLAIQWQDLSLENNFTLYARVSGDQEWVQIQRIDQNATSAIVQNLNSGTEYELMLQAESDGGFIAPSNVINVTTAFLEPQPPSNVKANASWERIQLQWSGSYSSKAEFVVSRKSDTQRSWHQIATLPASARSYEDHSVFSGERYRYRLFARNPGGESRETTSESVYVPFFSYFENGGFELQNFQGWEIQDDTNTRYRANVIREGFRPLIGFFASEPTEGDFALAHGFSGRNSGSFRIGQQITIPPQGGILKFDYRAAWTQSPNNEIHVFSVSLAEPESRNFIEIHPILIADTGTLENDTGSLSSSIDLNNYGGENLWVSFDVAVSGPGSQFGFFQLDNVRLDVPLNYQLSISHSLESNSSITVDQPPLGRIILEESPDLMIWNILEVKAIADPTEKVTFQIGQISSTGTKQRFFRVRNE